MDEIRKLAVLKGIKNVSKLNKDSIIEKMNRPYDFTKIIQNEITNARLVKIAKGENQFYKDISRNALVFLLSNEHNPVKGHCPQCNEQLVKVKVGKLGKSGWKCPDSDCLIPSKYKV